MSNNNFYLGASASCMACSLAIFLYGFAIKISFIRLVTINFAVNILVAGFILYYLSIRRNNDKRILDNKQQI